MVAVAPVLWLMWNAQCESATSTWSNSGAEELPPTTIMSTPPNSPWVTEVLVICGDALLISTGEPLWLPPRLLRLRFKGDSTAHSSRRRLGRLNVYHLAGASWYGGGGGLAKDDADLQAFKTKYRTKKFNAVTFQPGEVVEGFVGLDGGSTSTKAVLLSKDGLAALMEKAVAAAGS